jgi:L-malate glycosyltransferase
MVASPSDIESPRVLWISSHTGTPGSVHPEIELARALAAAGVELRIIAPERSHYAQAVIQAGLELVGSMPRGVFARNPRAWLQAGCREDHIEIVHMFDRLAVAAALPALRNLPLAMIMRHDRTGSVQRWNPIARLTQLHPRLDRVVCTSEAGREELARRRDPASVITIRPGHRLGWYQQPPANLQEFGVPPQAFSVAVVANYRPRKGIEYVVDSAQWLPTDAPVHFVMVGADQENRTVLERVARSPLRERFHLLGHRKDATRIIAACAVSVRGAVGHEGIPQTIIESMAYGVPPVITEVGGARELVEQGKSGIIVPRASAEAIGEAIKWLYENPAQRIAMGQAARARVEQQFPFSAAVQAHLELYRELREAERRRSREGL